MEVMFSGLKLILSLKSVTREILVLIEEAAHDIFVQDLIVTIEVQVSEDVRHEQLVLNENERYYFLEKSCTYRTKKEKIFRQQ